MTMKWKEKLTPLNSTEWHTPAWLAYESDDPTLLCRGNQPDEIRRAVRRANPPAKQQDDVVVSIIPARSAAA